jgi:hypothetical protein
MYSMAAFGPVCGFLLGAYLLSFHMDSLSSVPVLIGKQKLKATYINNANLKLEFAGPGDRRFVGMWWGGFFLCGVMLLLLSLPFMLFPKTLRREKQKVRLQQKSAEEKVNLVGCDVSSSAPRNSVSAPLEASINKCAKDTSCCFKAMGDCALLLYDVIFRKNIF